MATVIAGEWDYTQEESDERNAHVDYGMWLYSNGSPKVFCANEYQEEGWEIASAAAYNRMMANAPALPEGENW